MTLDLTVSARGSNIHCCSRAREHPHSNGVPMVLSLARQPCAVTTHQLSPVNLGHVAVAGKLFNHSFVVGSQSGHRQSVSPSDVVSPSEVALQHPPLCPATLPAQMSGSAHTRSRRRRSTPWQRTAVCSTSTTSRTSARWVLQPRVLQPMCSNPCAPTRVPAYMPASCSTCCFPPLKKMMIC